MGFWDYVTGAVDTATGGMITDWQKGGWDNKAMAIAKGLTAGLLVGALVVGAAVAAGVVVGPAAAIATTAATLMMGASTVIGVGVLLADTIPAAVDAFKEQYNKTLQEMEQDRNTPPNASPDDKVSQLNNTATPAPYAAVDTARLAAAEQQLPAELIAKDFKEQPVASPSLTQQAAPRPALAIRPA